jgi:hypothetical protein
VSPVVKDERTHPSDLDGVEWIEVERRDWQNNADDAATTTPDMRFVRVMKESPLPLIIANTAYARTIVQTLWKGDVAATNDADGDGTFDDYDESGDDGGGSGDDGGGASLAWARLLHDRVPSSKRFPFKVAGHRRFPLGCCHAQHMTLLQFAKRNEIESEREKRKPFVYFSGSVNVLGAAFVRDVALETLQVAAAALSTPQELSGFTVPTTQAWLGNRGVITPMHHDTAHNWFVQLAGVKRFYILPPAESLNVYPYPKLHVKNRQAQVNLNERVYDADNSDENDGDDDDVGDDNVLSRNANTNAAFPRLRKVRRGYVATVRPGDVFTIPPLWWHQVHTLRDSLSFNHFSPAAHVARMDKAWDVGIPCKLGARFLFCFCCVFSFIASVVLCKNLTFFRFSAAHSSHHIDSHRRSTVELDGPQRWSDYRIASVVLRYARRVSHAVFGKYDSIGGSGSSGSISGGGMDVNDVFATIVDELLSTRYAPLYAATRGRMLPRRRTRGARSGASGVKRNESDKVGDNPFLVDGGVDDSHVRQHYKEQGTFPRFVSDAFTFPYKGDHGGSDDDSDDVDDGGDDTAFLQPPRSLDTRRLCNDDDDAAFVRGIDRELTAPVAAAAACFDILRMQGSGDAYNKDGRSGGHARDDSNMRAVRRLYFHNWLEDQVAGSVGEPNVFAYLAACGSRRQYDLWHPTDHVT